MKKSVVAMTHVLPSTCQTAASSPVSVPTRSCAIGHRRGLIGEKLLQHRRRELAAAASAMREIGQAIGRTGHRRGA